MTVTASAPSSVMSDEEARIRRDLAAAYRLVAHYGWDDMLATHISARLPGTDHYLLNPRGLMFDEITASSLVKIDADGTILDDTPYAINRAGFVIHGAVHAVRHDAMCVVHLHAKDGVAVSATKHGLLPLNQQSMTILPDIAFHEFEGIAFDLEERGRLQQDLGDKTFMFLRNHGSLVLGPSVGAAFFNAYVFEWCCTVQVRTLAMNAEINHPPAAAVAKVPTQVDQAMMAKYSDELIWPALLRKLDRVNPGYDA
jgi:ribulose-5-phosphate 4-epimerase/fuculose-1-phosphate aldolase